MTALNATSQVSSMRTNQQRAGEGGRDECLVDQIGLHEATPDVPHP
jgi:hypothetical protein